MDLLSRSSIDDAARSCLEQPEQLTLFAAGLIDKNARRVADCAEVMTKVAESRPDLVAPHAEALVTLLSHKNGRVRWESAHALALVAPLVEPVIEGCLPLLVELIRTHDGVIVRDYAIDAVGRYGTLGPVQAARAWEILAEALVAWEGRHAARILGHAGALAALEPALRPAALEAARRHEAAEKPSVRKAAKALLKGLG